MIKRSHLLVMLCVGALTNSLACSSQIGEAAGRTTKAQISVAEPTASATPTPFPNKPHQAQQIDKIWTSQFNFNTTPITEKRDSNRSYEISADIPQIAKARTLATRKFNRWIKERMLGYVAEFRHLQRFADAKDKRKHLPPLQMTESLDLSHLVYYSDRRLISLRLTHTVMAMGQMHPIDYYETINYDLEKGRPLRPADIFTAGYLKLLSEYSRNELRDKYDLTYSTDQWVREGTSPKKENFDSWSIVPDGILISFADYQVAAHAFGKPEMIVPYTALMSVLRKRTPIREFVR